MSTGKFSEAQVVFAPDEATVCKPCRVIKCNGYPPRMAITLEPTTGGPHFSPSAEDAAKIADADPLALQGGPDLVRLSNLNEYAILHNLRTRYDRDEIYTNVGSILIAVNPFKDVSQVDEAVLNAAHAADAKAWDELPPHVYVLSEDAYRSALRDRKPQAILISGESGAGKTESTKLWLRHLVERSQGASGGTGGTAAQIQASLLHCNPVLESFGNAATTRNHNSSRFGKWIQVTLDAAGGGVISAAHLTSYLLERSRVTGHMRGERNFHAFYQLLAAAKSDAKLAKRLAVDAAPNKHRYLLSGPDASGSAAPVTSDDADRRSLCVSALKALGFDQAHVDAVDAVTAAVLHVGNITFEVASLGDHQDEGAAIAASCKAHLDAAVRLLGLDAEALADALTVRLVGRFPAVRVPLSRVHAGNQRDALARAIYAALFDDHLCTELNSQMLGVAGANVDSAAPGSGQDAGGGGGGGGLFIGCLDIFGFEAFETNGLEQLLINYANERLHHLFNVHVFQMDLKQLTEDGIDVIPASGGALEFGDNAATLSLLHGAKGAPGSILSLLSEEVTLPNGSDANYLEKCIGALAAQKPFVAPKGGAVRGHFGVSHYAGQVTYTVAGFVEKNRNAVPSDLVALLASSSVPLLAGAFGKMKAQAEQAAAGAGGGARTRGGGGARRGAAGGASGAALSAVFTRSLDALLDKLNSTSLHFVRCVKPNAALAPSAFDAPFVMTQLRYMGMLAVAEVRKRGFAHRFTHHAFFERYGMLTKGVDTAALAAADADTLRAAAVKHAQELAARLLNGVVAATLSSAGEPAPFAVGRTLVVMRTPLHSALEAEREVAVRARLLERVRAEASATHPDQQRLQEVVALALEVGLDSDTDVKRALQLLRQLRERDEVAQALKVLLAQGASAAAASGDRLADLVGRAKKLGVDKALVDKAEQLQARARETAHVEAQLRTALSRATGDSDAKTLEALIEKAQRLDVSAELLQQARREAEAAGERERVLATLKAAAASAGPVRDDEVSALAALLERAAIIGLGHTAEVASAQGRIDAHERQKAEAARTKAAARATSAAVATPRPPPAPPIAPAQQRLSVAGAEAAGLPPLAPLCQPMTLRLSQLEAGQVRAKCLVLSGSPQHGFALVGGSLSLSADHMTLIWRPLEDQPGPVAARKEPARQDSGIAKFFNMGNRSSSSGAGGASRLPRHLHAPSIHLPIANLASISVGPQSRETREALSAAATAAVAGGGGSESLKKHNVIALRGRNREGKEVFVELVAEESESALLCVCTLSELCFGLDAPAARKGAFGALHRAQQQWFSAHELHTRGAQTARDRVGAGPEAGRAAAAMPETADSGVLPLLLPLMDLLDAAASWLQMQQVDISLLWLLVEMVEIPLPPGLVWVPVDPARSRESGDGSARRVAIADEATGEVLLGHPYENFFRAKLARVSQGHPSVHVQTDPQALLEQGIGWRGRDGPGAQAAAVPETSRPTTTRTPTARGAPPAGVRVYQAILGGSVDGVQQFLDEGGGVDTFYRQDMGWDGVGSDWGWTRPNPGTTPLNYVCTMLDVIGDDVAAQMARVLLRYGADPLRDDCNEEWFLPVHNATANGGPETVAALLESNTGLANMTTGEGQTPLFTAALCERPQDRRLVVQMLLDENADVNFVEPFGNNTPLHVFARRGYELEAQLLCSRKASPYAQNSAGRTPIAEAERELNTLLNANKGGGEGSSSSQPMDQANVPPPGPMREQLIDGLTLTVEMLRGLMDALVTT